MIKKSVRAGVAILSILTIPMAVNAGKVTAKDGVERLAETIPGWMEEAAIDCGIASRNEIRGIEPSPEPDLCANDAFRQKPRSPSFVRPYALIPCRCSPKS